MDSASPLRTYEILLDDQNQPPLIIRGHELECRPSMHPTEIRVIVVDVGIRRIAYWSPTWRVRAVRDITGQESGA